MEIIVKKNEGRKLSKIEKVLLPVCKECSISNGAWEVAGECSCGCGNYFTDECEVICSEGRHFFKDHFDEMIKQGQVEEES